MAKNVIINNVTYNAVPFVAIPTTDNDVAEFHDTSDATLSSGGQMLNGFTSYSHGVKYTGNIQTKTQSDITSSGDTVTIPSGYYASASTKSIDSGTWSVPDSSATVTPTISVSGGGLITASVSSSETVSGSVTQAGYIPSGTKTGNLSVSGSATQQLTVQAAQTIVPTTSDQTISSGTYLTGAQTIAGDANLQPQNIANGVSIFGVEGILTSATISQDSTTKVLYIS